MACLCAPTSHEGSFRCRLHRAPNPIINPSTHVIKAVNPCINSSNSTCNQIGGIPYSATVRETSASTAPMDPLVNIENGRLFSHFPQVAADRQYGTRCIQSSLPSETFAGSSVSSSSPKSLSYRQPRSIRSSSAPSSLYISSSSSRASASSSSPSPLLPFSGTRPPPAKRPSLSSSSLPKCPYRTWSPLVRPTSWGGSPVPSNDFAPSPSHAAAMAIMKRHLAHSKRTHNRNTLSPTNSASKIGPSRLSRMAAACADELPILKEENNISGSHQYATSAPDTPDTSISSAFVDTSMPSGLPSVGTTHINVAQIGLKMRSAVYKFKQIETSCRVVGSNEGSPIMPIVY